jgi:hypothetical protein
MQVAFKIKEGGHKLDVQESEKKMGAYIMHMAPWCIYIHIKYGYFISYQTITCLFFNTLMRFVHQSCSYSTSLIVWNGLKKSSYHDM